MNRVDVGKFSKPCCLDSSIASVGGYQVHFWQEDRLFLWSYYTVSWSESIPLFFQQCAVMGTTDCLIFPPCSLLRWLQGNPKKHTTLFLKTLAPCLLGRRWVSVILLLSHLFGIWIIFIDPRFIHNYQATKKKSALSWSKRFNFFLDRFRRVCLWKRVNNLGNQHISPPLFSLRQHHPWLMVSHTLNRL